MLGGGQAGEGQGGRKEEEGWIHETSQKPELAFGTKSRRDGASRLPYEY